jgi:predicted dehydrogenase
MKRRDFLEFGAVAGAGLLLPGRRAAWGSAADAADTINVALIGVGLQGRALLNACLNIPGIRFRAVCDIWEYAQQYGTRFLERYGPGVGAYADLRAMLDQEKELDAVLIATPDFAHAEQTNACLDAGLHVYCEPMMSNTLDGARSMVRAMQKTGRLLQIGYQRRSNPRYRHVHEMLLGKAGLAGKITHVNTLWAHGVTEDRGWPQRFTIPQDVLQRYGYAGMHEFRNWQWFPKYCLGPCGVLGSHQLDICNWFLDCMPASVFAVGGAGFYESRECLDNVTAVCEYPTPDRIVRATSQVLTTTSAGGERSFERFMGTDGSIKMSENPEWMKVSRESNAPDWQPWVGKGYLKKPKSEPSKPATDGVNVVKETADVETFEIPVVLDQPPQQPHLENFFAAVRGTSPLNCPADLALRSEIVAHKMIQAAGGGERMMFSAEDFKV